ncbi:MAG: hypothetical protein JRH11_17405 [Deltaproteobacteria bacterium]|nr:hypothetical protein [Deltaproteobacteria bacterium]
MPIARPSDKETDLLHQWAAPLTPNDTVTVADGDSCVSIQFGKVIGIFEPGEHRLPAQIPEGVELWFCATRRMLGTKFGGNVMAGRSAFGDFTFRVAAPHLLVGHAAGMGSADGTTEYVKAAVMRGLTHAFGVLPPDPSTMGEAQALAAERINLELEPLGLNFSGFGTMQVN